MSIWAIVVHLWIYVIKCKCRYRWICVCGHLIGTKTFDCLPKMWFLAYIVTHNQTVPLVLPSSEVKCCGISECFVGVKIGSILSSVFDSSASKILTSTSSFSIPTEFCSHSTLQFIVFHVSKHCSRGQKSFSRAQIINICNFCQWKFANNQAFWVLSESWCKFCWVCCCCWFVVVGFFFSFLVFFVCVYVGHVANVAYTKEKVKLIMN